MPDQAVRVCFVCLGNICRSPTAEGVMRKLVSDADMESLIEIDSAGTAAYHVGERPDPRAREAALQRGISLDSRARRFEHEDFDRFDYVLAMDSENLENLRFLASAPEHVDKTFLLRNFDPCSAAEAEVPDPYYGGDAGFEEVLDLCEAACRALLEKIADRAQQS